MYFASDNCTGAHSDVSAFLKLHEGGYAVSYGESDLDRKVEATFCDVFERSVGVFFVSTGTEANALSMAQYMKPGGLCLCVETAHINANEGEAPTFLSPGRLMTMEGFAGKLDPGLLEKNLKNWTRSTRTRGAPVWSA